MGLQNLQVTFPVDLDWTEFDPAAAIGLDRDTV